ncbi:hypothetical protein GCM10023085_45090 [Actinomadura viridis]|uniref:Transcriptional regulator with XRE-family HTH domain n=1 Tax=Actinomadura viridis TaxID=58110 RepID=A0A931GNT4_9ACTN|nr:helix-turn-helix transcriptional regulator [Actinomadura viridis]MBG6089871.1 transcriptional regulator with XRE-family HTH domain [Actinomadura viridis]
MIERDLKRVARFVIAQRGNLGLSQSELAERAGVDSKTIWNLESAQRWPISRNRVKIEKALGVEPDSLAMVSRGIFPASDGGVSDDLLREAAGSPEFEGLLGQRAAELSDEQRIVLDMLLEELRAAEDARRRLIAKIIRYSKGSQP